uniref:R3H domain-containing protein n=1 Tax=Gelidium elegans TaxID=37200 RepID=A0A141SDA6_GELEL|nr:hypothetical protein Gele_010 [Gelidium elegans]AMK96274.1 hypothetical protein Gele_010 [Gelidium elegans]
MLIADDLNELLEILPDFVRLPLYDHSQYKYLIEVVMDLGRRPEARFPNGPEYLSAKTISWQDLDFCIRRIGNFSGDNRSGIERTLHRISSIRNRKGNIIGLTCRVGRAVFGTISIIRDLLEKGQSILLLGRPGVGKTTAIREIARVLADEMEKRVVIIDTSNEIAGDGDIPHPAIGRARRMQVARPELQHQVMIEAVENHMPEVIIIDEIGTELEALAACTIAERGVQLVGTAHGNYIESLIKNPILSDLIGGIQYVTLGDDEAKRRGSQKSILERKSSPAFQVAIEIHTRDSWIVHENVDQAVDQILQGSSLFVQRRKFCSDDSIKIEYEQSKVNEFLPPLISSSDRFSSYTGSKKFSYSLKKKNQYSPNSGATWLTDNHSSQQSLLNTQSSVSSEQFQGINKRIIIVYTSSVSLEMLKSAIQALNLPIAITQDIVKADIVLALRSHVKQNNKLRQIAKSMQLTIYTIHSSTISNITRAFKKMLNANYLPYMDWKKICIDKTNLEIEALQETRIAIETIILSKKHSVELLPRSPIIRKLQYTLISSYNLQCRSFGEEPDRRFCIYP